jgi:hypothetical protein
MILHALVVAATLGPFGLNEPPVPPPNDEDVDLTADLASAPRPLQLGVEAGGLFGPGVSHGYAGAAHLGYQLASGLTPDLMLAYSRWDFAEGWGVLAGCRLGRVDGTVRPYASLHLGTLLFPGRAQSEAFRGVAPGGQAGFGLQVGLTEAVSLEVQATASALLPSAITWANLGGGVRVQL